MNKRGKYAIVIGVLVVAILVVIGLISWVIINGEKSKISDGTTFENNVNCKDSDNGIFSKSKGIINYMGKQYADACTTTKNSVKELYCDSGVLKYTEINCSRGCSLGACISDSSDVTNNVNTNSQSATTVTNNAASSVPQCTNQCFPNGAKTCYGSAYYTCGDYNGDSCFEWGGLTNCSSGSVCSNGDCVQQNVASSTSGCLDSDGGRNILVRGNITDKFGYSYQDYCFNSSLVEYYCASDNSSAFSMNNCPAGSTCANGACVLGSATQSCVDECSSGASACTGTGFKLCGYSNSDSCLHWGAINNCPTGKACYLGVCVDSTAINNNPGGSVNICSYVGLKNCSGSSAYKVCGNYSGGILDWGSATSCASGLTCQDGNCVPIKTCTDLCAPNGYKSCYTDANAFASCGYYNGNECLNWSGPTFCQDGKQECKDAACVALPAITITAPNSGSSINRGSATLISWTAPYTISKFDVLAYQTGSTSPLTIASNLASRGTGWVVSVPSWTYKIRVRNSENVNNYDEINFIVNGNDGTPPLNNAPRIDSINTNGAAYPGKSITLLGGGFAEVPYNFVHFVQNGIDSWIAGISSPDGHNLTFKVPEVANIGGLSPDGVGNIQGIGLGPSTPEGYADYQIFVDIRNASGQLQVESNRMPLTLRWKAICGDGMCQVYAGETGDGCTATPPGCGGYTCMALGCPPPGPACTGYTLNKGTCSIDCGLIASTSDCSSGIVIGPTKVIGFSIMSFLSRITGNAISNVEMPKIDKIVEANWTGKIREKNYDNVFVI